jgi:opacity protein-like surface antigen
MKTMLRSSALLGSCCLGLLARPEVGRSQGFYLNADAGAALADNVDLNRFIVPTPGGKIKLDPGVRLSAAGGYNFNNYLGAEIETGFIVNEIKSMTGGSSIDAALVHTPLLANVVVRYDKPECKWVPYLGAGAGGDISVIAFDNVRAPNGSVVDGSGSTVVFAWQIFAGLRYKLTERISLGGSYKFFSANGATWDVEDTSGDIKADTARVHSLLVDFTIKF